MIFLEFGSRGTPCCKMWLSPARATLPEIILKRGISGIESGFRAAVGHREYSTVQCLFGAVAPHQSRLLCIFPNVVKDPFLLKSRSDTFRWLRLCEPLSFLPSHRRFPSSACPSAQATCCAHLLELLRPIFAAPLQDGTRLLL